MSEKLDMQSPDLVATNIDKIAALFPHCVTETAEGKAIDFDLLKQELNHEIVEGTKERYRLEWPGKREAIVMANIPTTKTLRPIREDSVDFDTTENLYIEGDNLEVLKLLQESYLNKIKMIYIDPPYNTGKDFVYKDNFTQATEEYKEESGLLDDAKNRLVVNPETNGRYHSDWLSMMYPRLKLARNLMTDDGVIFISIDENEACNLEKLCREIFGETNFIGTFPVIMNLKGNQDAFCFADIHEFFIVCTKNKTSFLPGYFPLNEDEVNEWSEDEFGLFKKADTLRRTGQDASRERRPKGWFPVFIDIANNYIYVTEDDKSLNEHHSIIWPLNEENEELSWSWGKSKISEEPHNLIIINGRNGLNIYKKQRPQLGDLPTKKPKSVLYKADYSSSTSTNYLKSLFNAKLFDGPKPLPFIIDLHHIGSNRDSITLDFFSGSSTTAHAIMKLNAEDGGNRKFIMVQVPETTDEKSEAYKAGYKNICEIGKERIRRAGNKIKESLNQDLQDVKIKQDAVDKKNKAKGLTSMFDAEEKVEEENLEVSENLNSDKKLDLGFRVYRLADSNMKEMYYRPQDFVQDTLDLFEDNIKADRTPDDLLTQVLLDWGLQLSLPIEQLTIENKQVFRVAENSLFACFDSGIDEAFAKELATYKPMRVVFKDKSFKDNSAKENVKQLLKQLSVETEMKVI